MVKPSLKASAVRDRKLAAAIATPASSAAAALQPGNSSGECVADLGKAEDFSCLGIQLCEAGRAGNAEPSSVAMIRSRRRTELDLVLLTSDAVGFAVALFAIVLLASEVFRLF